jgi:hypothetical protein
MFNLNFLGELTSARTEQLKKQQQLDDRLKSLPCAETIRDVLLFERWMSAQMSLCIYKQTTPWGMYEAAKINLEWSRTHQQCVETALETKGNEGENEGENEENKCKCNALRAYSRILRKEW